MCYLDGGQFDSGHGYFRAVADEAWFTLEVVAIQLNILGEARVQTGVRVMRQQLVLFTY